MKIEQGRLRRQRLERGSYKPRRTIHCLEPPDARRHGMGQTPPRGLQKEPTLPTPRIWPSGRQNCERMISAVSNHAVCGDVLQRTLLRLGYYYALWALGTQAARCWV